MCVCVAVGGEVAENSLAKWRVRNLSLRGTGIEQEAWDEGILTHGAFQKMVEDRLGQAHLGEAVNLGSRMGRGSVCASEKCSQAGPLRKD